MPDVTPTASAVSNALASGSATLSDIRAAMRARHVSTDECASASRTLMAAGRIRPVRCTRSRMATRSMSMPVKLRVSDAGPNLTSQRQRSPTRGATGAARQARRARRRRPSPWPAIGCTSASKRHSAPTRAGTLTTIPSSSSRVSVLPGAMRKRLPFVGGLQHECDSAQEQRQAPRPGATPQGRQQHGSRDAQRDP